MDSQIRPPVSGSVWGELIALRPGHIDFRRHTVTVEGTIVEDSKRHSPTGERMIRKPYPKDNEPRTFGVRRPWLDALAEHTKLYGLGRDDLLFTTHAGTPISRPNRRSTPIIQRRNPVATAQTFDPLNLLKGGGSDGDASAEGVTEVAAHTPTYGSSTMRRTVIL